jgi:hypothetical protein
MELYSIFTMPFENKKSTKTIFTIQKKNKTTTTTTTTNK